ncbi:MAG: hypothetical protein HY820_11250 [Acidobacteria bacterium]|nr:hypothetical protein [Acidobacteriota bacterium]
MSSTLNSAKIRTLARFVRQGQRSAVLSCVGNVDGIGPGHTAIVVDDNVYTFEVVVGAWFVRAKSGWRMLKARTYFDENKSRPVVVQELNPSITKESDILAYIYGSDMKDEDYLSSGHCSYQASRAVSAGIGLDPGANCLLPNAYYRWLNMTGYVSSCYTAYPALKPDNAEFKRQMENDYPKANQTWIYPARAASWPPV